MKPGFFLLLAATLLGGCGRDTASAIHTSAERVFSVDEYLAQPDLRKKVSATCQNDPGRLGLTPNCVNVRRADHVAAIGKPSSLRIDLSP